MHHRVRLSKRTIVRNAKRRGVGLEHCRSPPRNEKGRPKDALSRSPVREAYLLDVGDLAVGALLPDVHHVVGTGDVALLVEGEVADHGLEGLAGLHGLGDLLGVERLGLLGRLRR